MILFYGRDTQKHYLFRCSRVEARKAIDKLYFPAALACFPYTNEPIGRFNRIKLSRSLEWNKHGDTWLSRDLSISHGTNNIAELYAIAIGLQLVIDTLHNNPNHTHWHRANIIFLSDSQYVRSVLAQGASTNSHYDISWCSRSVSHRESCLSELSQVRSRQIRVPLGIDDVYWTRRARPWEDRLVVCFRSKLEWSINEAFI
jgi:hypothetical protein